MGLDVGDVRTGVAISDPLGIVATPLDTIQVTSPGEDADKVKAIADEREVVRIVVGIPLNKEGGIGPQAQKVLDFVDVLRDTVDVEIVTQDERFSTAIVERALIQADVSRKGRKKVVDKLAAQQILQLYLDKEANKRSRET